MTKATGRESSIHLPTLQYIAATHNVHATVDLHCTYIGVPSPEEQLGRMLPTLLAVNSEQLPVKSGRITAALGRIS